MKEEVLDDDGAVARRGAAIIAADARDAVAARGWFFFAVSGGRTPWQMLAALAGEDVPWSFVHLFQVDERVAPAGDPDRNLTHIRESLLSHVPLPAGNLHAMPVEGHAKDLPAAAARYAADLESLAGKPAVLDLVHLGLGPDGHTASLVPNDPVLDVTDRAVALAGPYQGHPRMTLTFPVLDAARRILWLATGAEKKPMLARLRAGDRVDSRGPRVERAGTAPDRPRRRGQMTGGLGRRTLAAGDLEAEFLPDRGMLGASLRWRGVELLRRIEDLDAAAAKGSTAGIPLLHPWANRLDGLRYRAAGKDVVLDPSSPLLHLDGHGLPIHGVPWARLAWEVTASSRDRIAARLDWARPDLLAIFPFPHRLELVAALSPDALTIATTLVAGPDGPVPAAFGFHPYFGLPDVPRPEWRLELPAMRRLALDGRGIPTGADAPFAPFDEPLGRQSFDDGFALSDAHARFALSGGRARITVELLEGYRFAQVYAPGGADLVALEPMTAPTNALASGDGLILVAPGGAFRAEFRIRMEDA